MTERTITLRLYEQPEPLPFARGGLARSAAKVRGAGRNGDEILLHINADEMEQLKRVWGEPSINPETGLPEYGFLSKLWKKVKKVVKAVAPIALNFIPGVGTAMSAVLGGIGLPAGALATKIATGALGGAISGGGKGAIAGALTGGMLGGGGGALASKLGVQGALGKVLGNAALSGAASSALGGDFGKGALLGGGLTAIMPYANNALAKTKLGSAMGLQGGVETLTSPKMAAVGAQAPTIGTDGLEEVAVTAPRVAAPAIGAAESVASAVPWISSQAGGSELTTDIGQIPEPSADAPATEPRGALASSLLGFGKDLLKNNLGTMALGALAGAGGTASASDTREPVQLPPGFNQPLGNYDLNRTRTTDDASYFNYGELPEHVWFANNDGGTTKREDKEEVGMAAGGALSRFVSRGTGAGGREDNINAKLSENEYVVDAETVALLGDGSPEAGARKLDELRMNIRKRKGKALAKGKISRDAGRADQYLPKGA